MSVLAFHPGTGAQIVVDEGQLLHLRAAGWLTQAEHDANQAPSAEPAEPAEAAAPKSDGKTAKSG